MSLNHDFFESKETLHSREHLSRGLGQIANDYNRACNEIRHNLDEFENAFFSVIGSGKLNVRSE